MRIFSWLKEKPSFFKSWASFFSFKRFFGSVFALSKKEKIIFVFLFGLGSLGLVWFGYKFYLNRTKLIPRIGGVYAEGVVGAPRYINPAITDLSPAEELIESIVFSSLLRPDNQGGVETDLAESVERFENGKVYLVTLKKDLYWQDNERLTANDVAFSLELLKNPELKNPNAEFWREVQVEILSDITLRFTLSRPYYFFPYYLTFKVLPRHLWSEIQANAFVFSDLNLKPIGSGPYKFKRMLQNKDGLISQMSFVRFDKYYLEGPYLETINLRFFSNQTEAETALRKKEIDSLVGFASEGKDFNSFEVKTIPYLRIFGLFFNTENEILSDRKLRQAIDLAINKQEIIDRVFAGQAKTASSPIIKTEFIDQGGSLFDPDSARQNLSQLGWQDKDEDGILEKRLSSKDKLPTKLELSLLLQDLPELMSVGQIIKENLSKLGISVILKPMSLNEFSSRLQARSYQMVLVGQANVSGNQPDPYPFWHSSQTSAPGLNFSFYQNQEADRILDQLRLNFQEQERQELYQDLDQLIRQNQPASFLYSPRFVWVVNQSFILPEIKQLNNLGDKFSRINLWHLYQKRVWD
ncbi:MAG: ABC transporter substrate-binding protein [Patescibacteria group bacterium]